VSVVAEIRDVDLPRDNGELVFDTPWAGRAFGIAMALHAEGVYEWGEFRDLLVTEIGSHEPDDGTRYYDRWLDALQRLLLEQEMVTEAEITTRIGELAAQAEHTH
jgi:nitrile hydratase